MLRYSVLALLAVTCATGAVISPLSFWTDGNTGVTYLYNTQSRADALTSQAKCAAQGGSLLSIESQADIDSSAYSQAMQVDPSGALFWTGLKVIIPEKSAVWQRQYDGNANQLKNKWNGIIFEWSDGSSASFISNQTDSMNLVPGCKAAPTGNTTCCGALYNAPSEAYLSGFPAIFFQPCVMLMPSICVIQPPPSNSDGSTDGGGVASLVSVSPPVKKTPQPPKKPPPPPFAFIGLSPKPKVKAPPPKSNKAPPKANKVPPKVKAPPKKAPSKKSPPPKQ